MTTNMPNNGSEYVRHVLQRNPGVSRSVVAQNEKLEQNLKKLGVDLQPRYTLSPPLGDSVRQMHNRAKT